MRSDRHRFLQRFVMARLAAHAEHADAATALLLELDGAAKSLPLARWDPALVFEVKLQLVRALKATSNRKDADKPGLVRRIAELQGEMIVLDPARMLSLSL
ncbi:hypothetical protein LMG27952_06159 [Paraburkholderia hiiakae]|uniref:Uncharacterized protein n=1 Tax=Paraburkholderia hiiakae TaxID=1081782 RepID=A0ABM8P569_9BURK|nr:hypothetical protein LMG27952_06159 [Paraburkholderia hiiakae]